MTANRNCSFCGWFSRFLDELEEAIRLATPEELARFQAAVRERTLLAAECPTDRIQ
jgi:hypothetical protein